MNIEQEDVTNECLLVGSNVAAAIEVTDDTIIVDDVKKYKCKFECTGVNTLPNGDLDCRTAGEHPLQFKIKGGNGIKSIKFVEFEDWPVIVGEQVPGGTCPNGYDIVEFGPPDRRSNKEVRVLFKNIPTDKIFAYQLNLIVEFDDGTIKNVPYDPKIINK